MEAISSDSVSKTITEDVNMSDTVLEIQHLKKSFGNNTILLDVNMTLQKGENLVVLGKSGSGKSVLIKCIVGLLNADEGRLVVLKKNIDELDENELNETRKKIGFLFQGGALYDSMTVRENLEFPLRNIQKKFKKNMDSVVKEALEDVGLVNVIDKMPSELSGGMRKRVALARTLILKPEIMLYDEPTTGMDPITSKEISKLIVKVQKKYNTASIIITHDMECAKITANRIVFLKDGLCVAEGKFEELEKSENKWIRSFFEYINHDEEKHRQ
jgi:phospholipid/cholesterol/gamma-HCH transport system ATP-binding protein